MAGTVAGDGNFVDTLHEAAAARLDEPFLLDPEGAAHGTYAEFHDNAARLAAALVARGVDPGDRVVASVAKSPEAVTLYLAVLHAGAVFVPLNPAFTTAEVDWFVEDADPALTIDDEVLAELVAAAGQLDAMAPARRVGDDLAALLYTSGTTGRPKGAALTHANLRHNARGLHRIWRFAADDVLLHALPVFHVHGLFVALHCAMLAAARVTFLPRFDVDTVVAALPRATVLMGVPTHYRRLLADPRFDATLTGGMRLFTSGSAPLPDAVFHTFTARTGHRICERYGMSEAGIITSNPYDGERIPGTVGHALPGVELRVCDPDGAEVTAGTTGTVEVRGPNLFAGYWQRDDATEAAHRDGGWFVTGDVGAVDTDGRLTLQGRAGDMIISGGENIYPKEIELVLDDVAGVEESAVVGVVHPDLGEGVLAVVVADAEFAPADARAALGAQLARFKHPKAIVTVDSLPRNAMGKVQKNELRRTYAGWFSAPA